MIRAIITDIEGTTTSLSFVKDILFPYSRERIACFVKQHAEDPQIVPLLEEVRVAAQDKRLSLEGIISQLIAWIDADAKVTVLKSLQGILWEEGYWRGDLTSHIYSDVARNLRAWKEAGLTLYIFSSGSVQAQKLLFSHTIAGDLTVFFSGYFDTHIGSKQESDSYQRIAKEIKILPPQILFLSDVEAELNAAAKVGMKTIWLVREEKLISSAPHFQVRDFDSIQIDNL